MDTQWDQNQFEARVSSFSSFGFQNSDLSNQGEKLESNISEEDVRNAQEEAELQAEDFELFKS